MSKTVFLVEDDESLQTILEIALGEAGYQVELASDGDEALARLEHVEPDLIISDVMMPYVDGVQFWAAIHERLQYEGIPIILITALNRKEWFEELEAEGAVILQKPFRVEHLISLVDSFLADETL